MEFARNIHSAGTDLLTLINDILDLSKIEAGKMDLYLETFDAAQMAGEVASTIQPLVDKRGNRLEVEIAMPQDTANALVPNLITQPLIENAIKYGVARSQAPVRLEVIAHAEGGMLVLEVRNDAGDADAPPPPGGTRTGLRNIANRLQLHYGVAASLAAAPRPDGGYAAVIRLPLRKAQ